MTDREKLIDILEQAGTMRQFPGSLARILMENGVTFRPIVPGHTDQYNIAEMAYKNGYEDGKPKWIPVTERLPDTFGEFIVAVKPVDGKLYSDYADYDRFAKRWTTGLFFEIGSKVTHWMPLPEPPKEVDNG